MVNKLLMCPPDYFRADIPNNKWMEDLPKSKRKVNVEKAMARFFDLYSLVSQGNLVYLVPPNPKFQDQVFTADVGVVLPHLGDVAVLSNFRSEGRSGEELEVQDLLEKLGYTCYKSPYYFEGEAELKWIRENIYIGGYGIKSDVQALEWIESEFKVKVLKVELSDEYLYHLDGSVFPLDRNHVVMYASDKNPEEVKEIGKHVKLIKIGKNDAYQGLTNSVRSGLTVLNASNIAELPHSDKLHKYEAHKNKKLKEICDTFGLKLVHVNLSEFLKSGALLSCMVMHLNYDDLDLTAS